MLKPKLIIQFINIISIKLTKMRRLFYYFLIVIFGLFYSACKNDKTDSAEIEKSAVAATPENQMRDIPGLKRKRGLITKTDKATPGYILFHPSIGSSTYLANMDGEIVKEWKGDLSTMLTYLMDDGHIIRGERDNDFPTFAAGGQSGVIREYDWDGNLTWNFKYATAKLLTHHDIAVMPNGNILAIAWEVKTKEECIALGINPENLPEAGLWFDKIIEIQPTRPEGGEIVWEWRMWDHLVQNFDDSKPNYGDPKVNPRKLNLNPHIHPIHMTEEQLQGAKAGGFMTSNATVQNMGSDLTHLNAIYYNHELDQIAVSSYNFNEIYVIDHSTTTAQAKTSKGGKYGHGGNLLYRWGNPQNYDRGGPEDQKLYHQHDVRWIPKGYPGEGNIMIFNNNIYGGKGKFKDVFEALGQLQRPELSLEEVDNYTAVFEITPPINASGNYDISDGEPFGPSENTWTYTAPDKYSFYAPFISSTHRLKNGNTFINSGPRGRFFEVTPDGEIVWEYLNQYFHNYRLPDGSVPQPVGPFFFAQYRVTHIPLDHPALKGKDLKPLAVQPEPFIPGPPPEAH